MDGEKRRLEQYLLQRKASNVLLVDPRFGKLIPENIDRIRLIQAQKSTKGLVSDSVLLKQAKKRRKARATKVLRGEVARQVRERKRFERGERRERPEEEPRIVGEQATAPAGMAYDPDIERQRLDLERQKLQQRQLELIAGARQSREQQERELAVRRGELAAARAERKQERERLEQLRDRPPIIYAGNRPGELPDPIPEEQFRRLEQRQAQLRAEQSEDNRALYDAVQSQINQQEQRRRDDIEAIEARQQAQDENIRLNFQRQDAIYAHMGERFATQEDTLAEIRDVVLDRLQQQEDRLLAAQGQNRPAGYDDAILLETRRQQPVYQKPERTQQAFENSLVREGTWLETPTPQTPQVTPQESSLSLSPVVPEEFQPEISVVRGGGPLELPDITIGSQEPTLRIGGGQSRILRLQAEEQVDQLDRTERATTDSRLGISPKSPAAQRVEELLSPVSRAREVDDKLQELLSKSAEETAQVSPLPPITSPRASPRASGVSVSERVQAIEAGLGGGRVLQAGIEEMPYADEPDVNEPAIEPEPAPAPTAEQPAIEAAGLVEELEEDEPRRVTAVNQQTLDLSKRTFENSAYELAGQVRPGPRRAGGGRRNGLGYRMRNNTDREIKRIQPNDVVNLIGVEAGGDIYRFDVEGKNGARLKKAGLQKHIDSGELTFEKGHRHELGGHFYRNAYNPPPEEPLLQEAPLLQEEAKAATAVTAGATAALGQEEEEEE